MNSRLLPFGEVYINPFRIESVRETQRASIDTEKSTCTTQHGVCVRMNSGSEFFSESESLSAFLTRLKAFYIPLRK